MTTNPIATAVAPLKADAVVRAEQDARRIIKNRLHALENVEWDLERAAPYPRGDMSRARYVEAKRFREALEAITREVETRDPYRCRRRGEPLVVAADDAKIEAYVQQAMRFAGEQYDAFVLKLTAKIGACDSAELEGNHVWGHSILTVRKGDVVERWKTQQIVNCSVHGLLFNQWPTRRVK